MSFHCGHPTVVVFMQTINFFKLGSKVCMVDLPGYGFAYAKEEVKDAWEELVSAQTKRNLLLFAISFCFFFFFLFGVAVAYSLR